MKVALVTGPFPRGRCGVGDYVDLLAESLRAKGLQAQVIDSGDWSLAKAAEHNRTLRSQDFDIVQIHYPALGFGKKFGPHALSLLRKCVITLHEASQSHPLRRLALLPFSVRPRHVIFFSEFEREYGLKWAPWISGISSVIPPPSNIRRVAHEGPRSMDEIVSFGLIRPNNGHDDLLEFAEHLKSSGMPVRLRIVGSPQSEKFIPYFNELKRKSQGLPIIWDDGLSEVEVAHRLARGSIAYLPYPGGAAELRSTLKAALLNGLAIITTRGLKTPANLEGVVRFAKSPREALEIAKYLLSNPQEIATVSRNAADYVREWTWERTAELHESVYRKILNENDMSVQPQRQSFAAGPHRRN